MTTDCNTSNRKCGMPQGGKGCSQAGYVYFIREGRTGPVKIGFATDPKRRLETLQCGSPRALRFIGLTPGAMVDERKWHERFRSLRVGGEWFRPEPELMDAIKRLPRMDMPSATADRGAVGRDPNSARRQALRRARSAPDLTFDELRDAMSAAQIKEQAA